jgi:hypothetical protein
MVTPLVGTRSGATLVSDIPSAQADQPIPGEADEGTRTPDPLLTMQTPRAAPGPHYPASQGGSAGLQLPLEATGTYTRRHAGHKPVRAGAGGVKSGWSS